MCDFISFSKQMLEKLQIFRMSFSGLWFREVCLTVSSVISYEPRVPRHGVAGQNIPTLKYEGWNFNSGNYLFTTDTK